MKRVTLSLAIVLSAVIANSQTFRVVKSEGLNIRENANKESTLLGRLKRGDQVLVISDTIGWVKIQTQNGLVGFVAGNYLEKSADNTVVSESSDGDTGLWIAIFIVFGIFLYAIYKIKKFFVDLFGGVTSKTTPKIKTQAIAKITWWCCPDCMTLVKAAKQPSGIHCKVNGSHRWYKLGEFGERIFICQDCGIQVQTTKRPMDIYCTVNGSHRWDEL